ncbi:MAG: hypothetical protein JWL71_1485 [Acidobacteria bacterium]|nr:hypothetical protein [Acidobacteriota bacterium]
MCGLGFPDRRSSRTRPHQRTVDMSGSQAITSELGMDINGSLDGGSAPHTVIDATGGWPIRVATIAAIGIGIEGGTAIGAIASGDASDLTTDGAGASGLRRPSDSAGCYFFSAIFFLAHRAFFQCLVIRLPPILDSVFLKTDRRVTHVVGTNRNGVVSRAPARTTLRSNC